MSRDPKSWHSFVRQREFEMIMKSLSLRHFESALELGAGDGGQSVTIARYCKHLTCTELDELGNAVIGTFTQKNLDNVDYVLCDAQDLSRFPDNSFDLVFSSNMLEHVTDPTRCLSECKRVVSSSGLIIHTMPTRIWKLAHFVLHLGRYRSIPPVHGTASSHLEEFLAFGVGSWKKKFLSAGLKLQYVIGLPFYVGHGNSFIEVIKLGNRLGWHATIGYILSK